MLSLRKLSQDINESTCKWIPLPSLDREWTDVEVYKYFKLSEDEIKLIKETKINGYGDKNNKKEKLITYKEKEYIKINNNIYNIDENNNITSFNGYFINEKILRKKNIEQLTYKKQSYYLIDDNVYFINDDESVGELHAKYDEENEKIYKL
jgi:hypothetical protein